MSRLRLLRLNYKSRPIDQTVVDFFTLNAHHLVTLQLFEVKDIHLDDLHITVGQCINLENFVLVDCSVRPDWDHSGSSNTYTVRKIRPLSKTVDHLQLFSLQISPSQLVTFISMFRELHILELDRCDLDLNQIKLVLLDQPELHTLRCTHWTYTSAQNLTNLQMDFRNCRLQMSRQSFAFEEDHSQTMAATILSDYAGFSPILNFESFSA